MTIPSVLSLRPLCVCQPLPSPYPLPPQYARSTAPRTLFHSSTLHLTHSRAPRTAGVSRSFRPFLPALRSPKAAIGHSCMRAILAPKDFLPFGSQHIPLPSLSLALPLQDEDVPSLSHPLLPSSLASVPPHLSPLHPSFPRIRPSLASVPPLPSSVLSLSYSRASHSLHPVPSSSLRPSAAARAVFAVACHSCACSTHCKPLSHVAETA